jgi:hypothetical protein
MIASAITTSAPSVAQTHERERAGAGSVVCFDADRRSPAGVTTVVRVAATFIPDSRSRRMRLRSASRSDACW